MCGKEMRLTPHTPKLVPVLPRVRASLTSNTFPKEIIMDDKQLPLTQQQWLEFSKTNAHKIKQAKGIQTPEDKQETAKVTTLAAGERDMIMENIRRVNSKLYALQMQMENLEGQISVLRENLEDFREFIGAPDMDEVYQANAEAREEKVGEG